METRVIYLAVCKLLPFNACRTCTNSSSWAEKSLSLEAMPDSLFDELRRVHYVLTKKGRNQIDTSLEQVFSSSDDISMRTSMMEFVRNATLLCCTVFPQNHILEEAVLIAEELSNTAMNTSSCSVTPCRTLAKSLLKSNRQVHLLFILLVKYSTCVVYSHCFLK